MARFLHLQLVLLSAAAGCVDAMAFLASGVFPANMTGNSVVLALAIVRTDLDGVALSGVVLAGFFLGALVGGLALVKSSKGAWTSAVTRVLIGVAGLLLADLAAVMFLGRTYLPEILFMASVAMGLQGAAVLKLGVSGVATTVVTGALTTGIVQLAERFRSGGVAPLRAGELLPFGSWIAYAGGALIGGLYETRIGLLSLAAPALLVIAVVVLAGIASRRG